MPSHLDKRSEAGIQHLTLEADGESRLAHGTAGSPKMNKNDV